MVEVPGHLGEFEFSILKFSMRDMWEGYGILFLLIAAVKDLIRGEIISVRAEVILVRTSSLLVSKIVLWQIEFFNNEVNETILFAKLHLGRVYTFYFENHSVLGPH